MLKVLLPKFLNSMLFVKKILLAIASSLQLSSITLSSVLYLVTMTLVQWLAQLLHDHVAFLVALLVLMFAKLPMHSEK